MNEEDIFSKTVGLIPENTEGNPEKAVSAATKLAAVDYVDFLLRTTLSSIVLQVAEVTMNAFHR